MPLSDDDWSALARGLRRAAARVAPQWTETNAHDPGVAVLELLAYALDDLAYRSDRLSDDARAIVRRLAARASAIAARDGDDTSVAVLGRADGALVRPRFSPGQLLTDDDLTATVDYVRERIDRRNRVLYGAGVVDGLAVSIADDGGAQHVVVAPGLAFDGVGREIHVGCKARLALPGAGAALLVCLAYRERPARSVPVVAAGDDSGDDVSPATRIVETFQISLDATPADGALPIARVRRSRGRWRVDPRFRVDRVRR